MQRDLRVSDVERSGVVRQLEKAMRDGRITVVEFDERAQAPTRRAPAASSPT